MNWLRRWLCPERGTEVRLDDLQLGDGDKLVLIYDVPLSATQEQFVKLLMEDGLRDGRRKVIVLDGGPRLQVVRKA